MLRYLLVALIAILGVACKDDPAMPTDSGTSDTTPGVDADDGCAAGNMCLRITPIDGVSALPVGRIAIAWLPPEGSGLMDLEVAYDAAWPADQVTTIALTAITPPSTSYRGGPGPCTGSLAGSAMIVISTDPDHDGSISSAEIIGGRFGRSIYGIGQDPLVFVDMTCAAMPPDFPDGLLAGVHLYSHGAAGSLLDGMPTPLQTCMPGTAPCDNLTDPF